MLYLMHYNYQEHIVKWEIRIHHSLSIMNITFGTRITFERSS